MYRDSGGIWHDWPNNGNFLDNATGWKAANIFPNNDELKPQAGETVGIRHTGLLDRAANPFRVQKKRWPTG